MRPSHFWIKILTALTGLLLLVPVVDGQNAARISLDQAIDLALAHNHSLKATRTLILQNQAQEITANLRPNPTFLFDSQFVPIFNPNDFSADNLDESQQFDVGVGYLFERGHKRQRRLQAAQDQTSVTRAQVTDAERTLTFDVAQQFIAVLLAESSLQVSLQDLKTRPGPIVRRIKSSRSVSAFCSVKRVSLASDFLRSEIRPGLARRSASSAASVSSTWPIARGKTNRIRPPRFFLSRLMASRSR